MASTLRRSPFVFALGAAVALSASAWAQGDAHIAGSVFITRQHPAGGFLRGPLGGFRIAAIAAEGEVATAASNPAGAFIVQVPAGKKLYVRCDAPAGFPVPFIPSASQYFTLDAGKILLTEIPMAPKQLGDLLPRVTIPSTALAPGQGIIEAIFEDATGARIRGATFLADGYTGPTYYMTDMFPVMRADIAGTAGPGAAMLLNVPAAAEVMARGQSAVAGASGAAGVPVIDGVLTNVIFSALNDQNGVAMGAAGAVVGSIMHASAGGPTLLTLSRVSITHGPHSTFDNDGGAFLLTGLPVGESIQLTYTATGYATVVSDPIVLEAAKPALLAPVTMLPIFRRGDANGDGEVNVADPMKTLQYLFLRDRAVPCVDALDANDDGAINIADPVALVMALFASGPAIPPPADCGPDPTPDAAGELGCEKYPRCP